MLKTSQNKMFAALKYHSTDYLYESMARQKFSIWKLSLCFPPCLHQDEKYHLNGLFADDKYRKPWTRIGSTQNMIAISVLDQKWKKSLLVEDFLEKKPIFSVGFQASNDLIEVIPSSNPCSQTGTEECFLLTKNGFKGDSTQDKYLKIYYATEFKEPQQDLCLEEEFVFIDNLENFRRKLPTLSILLSRLQFFLVKDPLLDSEGQILRAENIFRECLTFQNEIKMEESQNELQGIKENFCTVSIKDEEYFLLPAELEFGKPSNGRSDCVKIPSYLQLKEMLNLTPVTVDDEDICKQVIREEHPDVNLAHQHHSLTELQKKLPVEIEAPMLGSLEEGWWLHMGLSLAAVEILEQFNMDGSNANSLLPTEIETFTKFTSYQLERWLEEKNSVTNQELLSAERHQSEKVVNPDLSLQIQRQYFATSAASSANIHSTNTSVEELTGGSIRKIKTEEAICFLNQEKKIPKPSESESCKDVSSKLDKSSCSGKPASLALASKWADDDSDLNNFIMMRSKHIVTQREEKHYVDRPENVVQPEEQHMCVHKDDDSFCETVKIEERTPESEDSITVNIQPSESQLQAFFLLEEAAIPVLKDLTHLGVLASVTWSFDSVKFDHTRFFLKQQEKVICDNFQQGKIDEKEIMLFRHAALVHLLVTVRDLLLTCGLDTALGYLSKAKDIYKNILESCLNNIWRQLKIIQYSSQKKHETHPKITALQCEILNWMKSYGEKQSVKILIITRMDSEKAAFIHPLSGIDAGLKVVDLNSEKKGSTLSCKEIISNLSRYSCVIVHNQQIGADFPWTHFSLVMEYDYSENSGWKNLCKNLNITYMTFKTTLPGTIQMRNHGGSFLLEVQIPYVFLTTEGLLNMPDILQLFESKYSITFVERSSSYSLRLFGSIDRYVVLTIDEGTAIFLQSMEELNYEDSCDTVILRLMALSLQYMCCWIIFYSRERLSSEYSLKGNTLLNLVLIYATLIELTQKSEDFEVKVILTPGIEETALVIRQIADNILIASDISPHEWLDKSWLSVLPSETEKCLLTFPCINPLVAQFMLKKGSSLNRLFLASFDQLQELLPEVPKKVLKHFSDMVSSYSLNTAAPLEKTVKSASRPENQNNFNTLYLDNKQNCQILDLLDKAQNNTGTSHMNFEPLIPPLNHHKGVLNSDLPSCMRKKACLSDVITRRKPDFIAVSKDYEDFAHLEVKNSLHVQRQPFRMHDSSDNSSKDCEKEDFFATFSDCVPQESFKSFLEEFTDTTCNSPEIQIAQPLWNDSLSTSPHNSFAHDDFLSDFFNGMDKLPNLNFNQVGGASKGKRKQRPPFFWTKENIKTDSGFPEVQEFKKRKLTYERVPGRRDGQTRLKFF
ncbi:protein shortage in chiasmata 1 ortholog isoform X10 [Parus major]|uniref:protein shortage in chiasmata 1 ortholog isoform X10 n=1 Tax=Parus major TaxID=9157 RepID=UPI00077113DA|nr:protein shortage in chiasmata 1 ortholog isoform X10 [Parus major]